MRARSPLVVGLLAPTLFGLAGGVSSVATAGPHSGGTLILHECPTYCFSGDPVSICALYQLDECQNANTREDGKGLPGQTVWWIVAAFLPSSSPELRGVTYGIDYDANWLVLGADEPCGDFSLPTPDWPEPGSGNAVTWNEPQTALLTLVHSFMGYAYIRPTSFSVTPHPIHGGTFGDNSIPSVLDPVTGYGVLGFGVDGFLPCPLEGASGACCVGQDCLITTPEQCASLDGDWQGEGSDCGIVPCLGVPGACCVGPDCVYTSAPECAELGGDFQGEGVDCAGIECAPVPTQETSWGQVKRQYR